MSTALFPSLAGLEYPVVRSPIWKTLTQESVSGKENRAALWTYPRWKWTLSFNFLRDDSNNEFRTLLGFYLARQGSYDSFLWNDPDDNSVTGQPIGIGDGSTLLFQVVRTFGGFTEPVWAPHGSVTVYVGGTPVSPSTFGVNSNGGVLTFNPGYAPGNGVVVSMDFSYYWPVRFVDDTYDFSKFMNKLWEQKKLEFESLKNWP
jgi:uncharacterized protein (TIGR02217 family)